MKKLTLIFIILLSGCATPLKPLSKNVLVKDVVFMNPDPKICRYKRTVKVSDMMWGEMSEVLKDINHLAAESSANVARILKIKTQQKKTDVELYKCPDEYVANYLKKNFKSLQ